MLGCVRGMRDHATYSSSFSKVMKWMDTTGNPLHLAIIPLDAENDRGGGGGSRERRVKMYRDVKKTCPTRLRDPASWPRGEFTQARRDKTFLAVSPLLSPLLKVKFHQLR